MDACTGRAVLGAAGDRARACGTLLSHWRWHSWILGSPFGCSSIAHPCYIHMLLPELHAGLWVLAGTESLIHPTQIRAAACTVLESCLAPRTCTTKMHVLLHHSTVASCSEPTKAQDQIWKQ